MRWRRLHAPFLNPTLAEVRSRAGFWNARKGLGSFDCCYIVSVFPEERADAEGGERERERERLLTVAEKGANNVFGSTSRVERLPQKRQTESERGGGLPPRECQWWQESTINRVGKRKETETWLG